MWRAIGARDCGVDRGIDREKVEGVGLVVAFRGTASTEDVLVDVNIRPAPLATTCNMRGEKLCRATL